MFITSLPLYEPPLTSPLTVESITLILSLSAPDLSLSSINICLLDPPLTFPSTNVPSKILIISASSLPSILPVILEFATLIVSCPLFPEIASWLDNPSLLVIVLPLIVELLTVMLSFPASHGAIS